MQVLRYSSKVKEKADPSAPTYEESRTFKSNEIGSGDKLKVVEQWLGQTRDKYAAKDSEWWIQVRFLMHHARKALSNHVVDSHRQVWRLAPTWVIVNHLCHRSAEDFKVTYMTLDNVCIVKS